MKRRSIARSLLLAALSLGMAVAGPAGAETCNAGHGCKITCDDGCSAVYNHDTGECSTACGQPVSVAGANSKRDHVSAVFMDTPRTNVDRLLKAPPAKPSPQKK